MDFNQTWIHIHLGVLIEKFGLNSHGHVPPWTVGKKAFLGADFEL